MISRVEVQLIGLPAEMPRAGSQHDRGQQLQRPIGQEAKNGRRADPRQQDHAHQEAQRAPGGLVADQAVEQRQQESVEGQEAEQGRGGGSGSRRVDFFFGRATPSKGINAPDQRQHGNKTLAPKDPFRWPIGEEKLEIIVPRFGVLALLAAATEVVGVSADRVPGACQFLPNIEKKAAATRQAVRTRGEGRAREVARRVRVLAHALPGRAALRIAQPGPAPGQSGGERRRQRRKGSTSLSWRASCRPRPRRQESRPGGGCEAYRHPHPSAASVKNTRSVSWM